MLKHATRPPAANDAEHRYQNMPRRPHHHLPLNVSTLDSSKHSQTSASISPGGHHQQTQGPPPAPIPVITPVSPPKIPNGTAHGAPQPRQQVRRGKSAKASTEEALTSLALLCLVSLLLALLALLFLLKISAPTTSAPEEFAVVYEVTLALCALTLSLNLCCLLVCAIQFLFAVKLVNSPLAPNGRSNKYLQKAAITRVCAVGGFFISIPVFLTGIILYTFIQFHSTPAIVTSVFIGIGIVFCGCAMVHNVFVWQREKTNLVKALRNPDMNSTHGVLNSTNGILNSTNGILNSTNGILNGTIQNLNGTSNGLNTSNGVLLSNGHINSAIGANLSYHNHSMAGAGGPYSHPFTLLHQGPYVIRPPTSTPPGDSAASPGVPTATIDLSHDAHELSTLV